MMNERIKELYSRAMSTDEYGYKFDPGKFAELIVRECAVIANKAENTDAEIRCMYDVITEHFGVE
jgi:hypothetical protein